MKKTTKVLILILFLALVLRSIHLTDKAPGIDEIHSIRNSRAIMEEGLSGVKDYGNPPGFYLFSGIILLSNSITLIKIIMVLIGLLTIALSYILVSRLINEKTALVTSFLLAINPMHVLYSQHIRVYILLMLIYLTSTILLYNFTKSKDNKILIFLAATYIIAVYLHYFSVFFILAHLLSILIINKKLIKKYLICLITAGIICLPLIPYFLNQYDYMITQGSLTTIEKLSITRVPYPIYKFSSMMDISSTLKLAPYLIITAPIVFIAFVLGSIYIYKKRKEESKFILLNLMLPILTLALIGFFFPVYSFRYLTYLLPLYIIPIAYLINFKKTGLISLATITILWTIILVNYYLMVRISEWPVHFAI